MEAISALGPDGEGAEHLEEELGDVLLQVVLHATIAAEEGWFTLADVARGIHDKMVGRHPHVFGSATAETATAVEANWERLKAAEKPGAADGVGAAFGSAFDDVSGDLPALLYALGRLTPEPTYPELQLNTPFNTRTHVGLPPGPISNPGKAALLACINPPQTSYVYYFTDPDGVTHFETNQNDFCRELAQHGMSC